MSLIDRHRETGPFIAALTTLRRRFDGRERWLAIDERGDGWALAFASWRHQGFELKRLSGDVARQLQSTDGVLLVAPERSAISDTVLQMLEDGWRGDVPCVTLFMPDGGVPTLFADGVAEPVSDEGPHVEPVTLHVRGSRPVAIRSTLPAAVAIQSSFSSAAFECSVAESSLAASARVRLSTPTGEAIGARTVVIDASDDGSGQIRLAVRATSPLRAVRLGDSWLARPKRLRLHLVIDRSTIDTEAWGAAYNLSTGWQVANPGALNSLWRAQLSRALSDTLVHMFPDVAVHLYWFADRPRAEGVALGHGGAVSELAAGRIGHVSQALLASTLNGSAFEYLRGLDLYDAADEALELVAGVIARDRGTDPDVVVVVGDSPPPPADSSDPVWRLVVNGDGAAIPAGLRSNARKSTLFTTTLKELRRHGVPVGWLFLRDQREAAADHVAQRTQHVHFRALRERVLEALMGFDGLVVHGCDDYERMGEALVAVVSSLLETPDGLSWARVRPSETGEWV
jgi:hypothetical protein